MASIIKSKQPCPCGASSDAMTYYEDGTGYCFSSKGGCPRPFSKQQLGNTEMTETLEETQKEAAKTPTFLNGEPKDWPSRALSKESCAFFGVWAGRDKTGETVIIQNYCKPDGEIEGQKIRTANKDFFIIGNTTELFGKHLWQKPQDVMVITEGEIDAVSVYQATKGRIAVTSLPNGAGSAKKTIKENLEWLEQNFKRIVLMFDNDAPGKKAAEEVVEMFNPGKCFLANLGAYKDANEVLQKGDEAHLREVLNTVEMWKPDGVVTFGEAWEAASKVVKKGLTTPFPLLTDWTKGVRLNEMIVVGAGSGLGKTTFFKEFILHFRQDHNEKVGVIFLEEPIGKTAHSLASKVLKKNLENVLLDQPDVSEITDLELIEEMEQMQVLDPEESAKARGILEGDPQDPSIVLYNHFGFMDYEKIREAIRYMVVARGCKYIFLDHLTALTAGDEGSDERRRLDYICSDLSALLNRYDFTLFAISHLSKPFGKAHEEGGKVSAKDLRGSQAIKQWAYQIWGLEKNQQDPNEKNFIKLRILKDRNDGQCVGRILLLRYDPETARLIEVGETYDGDTVSDLNFPKETSITDEF